MTPEELTRAVKRLRGDDYDAAIQRLSVTNMGLVCRTSSTIREPLAELIEAAARPLRYRHADHILEICHICRQRAHAPDCALVALVRAINGEGEW